MATKAKVDAGPKDPQQELNRQFFVARAVLFKLRDGAKSLNDEVMRQRAQAAIDGIMGKKAQ